MCERKREPHFFGLSPSHPSAYESRRRALTRNKTSAAGKMRVSICGSSKQWLVSSRREAGDADLPLFIPLDEFEGGLRWRPTRRCWLPPQQSWAWTGCPLSPPPCDAARRAHGGIVTCFVRQAAAFFPSGAVRMRTRVGSTFGLPAFLPGLLCPGRAPITRRRV